ncbi:MAG TPA: T9SS type A sorting domain-containing protein [Bacteroides sp.]|nr:T9SS type A sorting domain-containing protein [Bacteroides sp.]
MRHPAEKYIPTLVLILVFAMARGQEININVPLSQPRLLEVEAGPDVRDYTGGEVTLGEEVVVTGGTPDFIYRWEDGSGNTWTGELITVSGYGDYILTVTDANRCTDADAITVIDAVTASMRTPDQHPLYPNPANGMVSIPPEGLSGQITLEITATTGSVVFQKKIEKTGPDPVPLEIGHIPPGMYLVRISDGQHTVLHTLVIE